LAVRPIVRRTPFNGIIDRPEQTHRLLALLDLHGPIRRLN